ncbi:hypothetical protein [Georgenia thermotolerans]|uniref:hypothetical protein n=1 Tax=Georgenia thermotolerans TaxID=527326 RepID=UPI0029CA7C5C|nr:hypothetical protein [Georgenia thermotolerans]
MTSTTDPDRSAATLVAADPYGWLEDVEGEEALAWVRARNAEAQAALTTSPRFEELRTGILEVLDSTAKIPGVVQRGEHLYNFWTDAEHVRGVWRRTTWASYRTAEPEWEVLIDVDALAEAEGVGWVWHGARVLRPSFTRALVSLSRGGSDADETREFDLVTKTFVPDGFHRPESKGGMGWADAAGEEVFVYTDVGDGSMTTSGYPRTVRRWQRGAPLAEAPEIFAGERTDLSVVAVHDTTPGFERDFVVRSRAFYDSDTYLLQDGALTRLDVPRSAEPGVQREWLTVELREDWEVAGRTYPGGALLATRFADFLAGGRDFEVLYAPTATTSLAGASWTRHHLVLNILDDVTNRLEVLTPPADAGPWRRRPLDLGEDAGAVPALATIAVGAVDPDEEDALWLSTSGFLSPTTLSRLDLDADGVTVGVERLKSLPAFFDATGLTSSSTSSGPTTAPGCRTSRSPGSRPRPAGVRRRPCSPATAASRSPACPRTPARWGAPGWPGAGCTSWRTSAGAGSTGRGGTRRRCASTVTAPTRTSPPWPATSSPAG